MATTKASQKAVNKYMKANYDRINLTTEKGKKDLIKAHAEKYDKGSVNAFINRAIEETMERDNKADPEAILTAFNKMEEAGYRLTPCGREYKRKLQETAAPSTLTEQKQYIKDMATELGYEVIEKGTPLEEATVIYTDTPEALPENIGREKVNIVTKKEDA